MLRRVGQGLAASSYVAERLNAGSVPEVAFLFEVFVVVSCRTYLWIMKAAGRVLSLCDTRARG